jgi:peroxidase
MRVSICPLLALVLGLVSCQYSDDPHASGCALIIPGSGKSSLFDHASSSFGGGSSSGDPYHGTDTCVTFEAVNAAFLAARDSVGLPPVRGAEFETNDVGNLGTVIHETSRYLAKQYGLTKDAISSGLPLIDTTKTVIERYCPSFLMTPQCKTDRYRELSGACNNLEHAHWGRAMSGHHRFLPPDFADGISAPRASFSERELPSPRIVSTAAHGDEGFHDHAVTLLLVAWGQYIDHDITLTAESRDPRTNKTPKCCDGSTPHPNCLPIEIPQDDSFYSKFNQRCMNFVRSQAGLRHNCRLGARDSFNTVSSVLDVSTVYGNTEKKTQSLRSYESGRLKTLPVFEEFGLKDLLPLKLEDPDDGCIRPSRDVYCFLAGDDRVNEQTVLAIIHLIFVREHNRLAEGLAEINPHWNDETLFQESRHILAAMVQHITYNEFLPMVLGKEVMQRHGLVLVKNGYADSYDSYVNPSAANGFTTAAFRFGHTLLPSTVERWSKTHRYVESQRLSEMLQQPYDLFKGGWADTYMLGLVNQVAQAFDDSITQEVTNHLFQEPGKSFGLDLAALNMQRGREHGIPSYNRWREMCGFPTFNSWGDMAGVMSNATLAGYSRSYEAPEDVDLWTGGVSEKPMPGSMVGPTFGCIIAKQFGNLRKGDRFWYENGGWPSSFTLEQLSEIRKVKLSRMICDNGDDIETIQVYGMVLPDHEINPRVACNSGVLPKLNLNLWKDASYHSSPPSDYGHGPFKK